MASYLTPSYPHTHRFFFHPRPAHRDFAILKLRSAVLVSPWAREIFPQGGEAFWLRSVSLLHTNA